MKKKSERNIVQSEVLERSIRKAVRISTRLINGDEQYDGYIINISSRGVGLYVNTKFPVRTIDCRKGSLLKLELQSPFGEDISLQCKVRWFRMQEGSEHGLIMNMGMEVIDPTPVFMNMFNSLL